ncbi:hypothetical protein [Mesorhizobium dulcispinae]|uniref:hypothetical protein n=1 Tax=Mesorhizobium dulcispinae TaxID=3072316 RepID=UPI002A240DBD|nr:hypothetical protein [Mesorhizobium sp. VK23D]MDX8522597.1 hypothetical protein [Mesorhizobium sp. VK23D]
MNQKTQLKETAGAARQRQRVRRATVIAKSGEECHLALRDTRERVEVGVGNFDELADADGFAGARLIFRVAYGR